MLTRFAAAIALALVGVVVYLFAWPQMLWGQADYVVISGSSMEPTYYTGDLVVVRSSANYAVGDIVAFRTDQGDVIHRVAGGHADAGFVMLGDNKDAVDPWRPKPQHIIGKAWLHLPHVGSWIARVRDTISPPLAFGIAGALLLMEQQRRRRRRRKLVDGRDELHHHPESDTMWKSVPTLRAWSRQQRVAAALVALAAIVIVVLAPVAWSAWTTAPTETIDVSRAEYAHTTAFSYTAVAEQPTLVYPEGRVGPVAPTAEDLDPEPEAEDEADGAIAALPDATADNDPEEGTPAPQALYTGMLERLDVTVDYKLESDRPVEQVSGRAQTYLRIETPEGWNETLPVAASTPVTAGGAELGIPVELAPLTERVAQVAELSGVGVGSFDVVVVADVDVTARLGRESIEDQVVAQLPLTISPALVEPSAQLAVVEPRSMSEAIEQGNAIRVLGVEMSVGTARSVTTAVVLLALAAAMMAAYFGWAEEEPARIRALHRSILVDVAPTARDRGRPISVRSMGELARLAKRDNRMVLHQQVGADAHRYFVPDGDLTYEYRVQPDRAALPGPAAAAPQPSASTSSDSAAEPAEPGPRRSSHGRRRIVVKLDTYDDFSEVLGGDGAALDEIEREVVADGYRFSVERDGVIYEHLSQDPALAGSNGR